MTRSSVWIIAFWMLNLTRANASGLPPSSALTPSQLDIISKVPAGTSAPISPPTAIYHWNSAENLKKIADGVQANHSVPLVDALNPTNFQGHFPEMRNHRGLFGWSHPITAVGTEHVEMYGDHALKAWIRKDARTGVMVSEGTIRYPANELNRNYDIVLHIEKVKGRNQEELIRLREWIVLNPQAIEKVSADPDVLRQDIEPWYQKISDPEFQFAENDLHFHGTIYQPGHNRDFFVKTKLRRYLSLHSADAPEALRGEVTLDTKPCSLLTRITPF